MSLAGLGGSLTNTLPSRVSLSVQPTILSACNGTKIVVAHTVNSHGRRHTKYNLVHKQIRIHNMSLALGTAFKTTVTTYL